MSKELLAIDVGQHIEKKGGLSYLSWSWAWAKALEHDPKAQWRVVTYQQADGTAAPCIWVGDTALVHTEVTISGITRSCILPVMDHKNNAIKNPDARKISDSLMRCMTKACAMHGLGLYIYAGEDVPMNDAPWWLDHESNIRASSDRAALATAWDAAKKACSERSDASAYDTLKSAMLVVFETIKQREAQQAAA